jgi:hypothetical protein
MVVLYVVHLFENFRQRRTEVRMKALDANVATIQHLVTSKQMDDRFGVSVPVSHRLVVTIHESDACSVTLHTYHLTRKSLASVLSLFGCLIHSPQRAWGIKM